MIFGFTAAKSKKTPPDDQPATASMGRGNGEPRRNLTQEDRKVRHQQARRPLRTTAADDEYTQDGDAASSINQVSGGGYCVTDKEGNALSQPFATPSEAHAESLKIPNAAAVEWKSSGPAPRNSDPAEPFEPVLNPTVGGRRMPTVNREAQLLQALASPHATYAERQRLLADLAQVRQTAMLRREADAEIDLGAAIVAEAMTPVRTHEISTTATDWMGEVADDLDTVESDPVVAMRTSASLWFQRTSSEVREDGEEYLEQAKGMSRHLAGQFGLRAPAAADAFLRHAVFLNRANLRFLADEAAGIQPDVEPGAQFPWGTETQPTVAPISATQETLQEQPLLGSPNENLDTGAQELDPLGQPVDGRPSEHQGRRRHASFAVYDDNGTQVAGPFDDQDAANQAKDQLTQQGDYDGGTLTVKTADPSADSDVSAGAASNESNPAGQGSGDDDDDDSDKTAKLFRFCSRVCHEAWQADARLGFTSSLHGRHVCAFCGQHLAVDAGESNEDAMGVHEVIPSRHDEAQDIGPDGLIGDNFNEGATERYTGGDQPMDTEAMLASFGRSGTPHVHYADIASDWDDSDKDEAYAQSGEGQSSMPVAPSDENQTDTFPTFGPADTGQALVPSDRAPNIAENEGGTPADDHPNQGGTMGSRRPRFIRFEGRLYRLADDQYFNRKPDSDEDDHTNEGGRSSGESHDMAADMVTEQAGDAASVIPNVEVDDAQAQQPMWPWEIPTTGEQPGGGPPNPSGAAAVGEVPTPGAGTGYPQPDSTSTSSDGDDASRRQSAFRARIAAGRRS